MIWLVVRLTTLALELGGLFYTAKRLHEERYFAAFLLLLFDIAIVVSFVLSHYFVEVVIGKSEHRNRERWWV